MDDYFDPSRVVCLYEDQEASKQRGEPTYTLGMEDGRGFHVTATTAERVMVRIERSENYRSDLFDELRTITDSLRSIAESLAANGDPVSAVNAYCTAADRERTQPPGGCNARPGPSSVFADSDEAKHAGGPTTPRREEEARAGETQ